MEIDISVQIVTVASVAGITMLLLNSIIYYYILDMKYNDKINMRAQFLGLVMALVYQLDLLLINLEYFTDYPSDLLMPRKMYWGAWVYLIFLNGMAIVDSYAYYLEYVVSAEDWTYLGNLIDFLMSLLFLALESTINIYIIVKISSKVRHQNNPNYKILVRKLSAVLFIYFALDIIIMATDLSDYQMYGCIFWGVNYAFKIQTETLCLGKIRECVMIMENIENA